MDWTKIACDHRFVVFDLDGTILDESGSLMRGVYEGVNLLTRKHLTPIIATGRSFDSLRSIQFPQGFLDLFEDRVVCNDGNVVADILSGDARALHVIDNHYFPSFYSKFKNTCSFAIESEFRHYVQDEDCAKRYMYSENNIREYMNIVDFDNIILGQITEIVLFPNKGYGDWVFDEIDYEGTMVTYIDSPEISKITLVPEATCKTHGLRHILQESGHDLCDVIAFGNGLNDVELLSTSSCGIAVKCSADLVVHSARYTLDTEIGDFLINILGA